MSDDLTGTPAPPAEPLSEHLRPTRMALWSLTKYTREALTDWPNVDADYVWGFCPQMTHAVAAAYRSAVDGSDGHYRGLAGHREAWPMLATAVSAILRHRLVTRDPVAEGTSRMVAGALLPLVEADYQAIRRASI